MEPEDTRPNLPWPGEVQRVPYQTPASVMERSEEWSLFRMDDGNDAHQRHP